MMLAKIKNRISTDFSGIVYKKLRKYKLRMLKLLSGMIAKSLLQLKGVHYGRNCSFFGVPIVTKEYNSKIIIGDHCTFRSDKTSNLIGLNRRTMLSTLKEGALLRIGNKSGLSGTVIGAAESVILGENVLCGANVLITDYDWHPIPPDQRRSNVGAKSAPVVIEDNVWLGVNSVVLKGVTIGKNTIIGANSLVVKDIPANVIAGGNPCKVLKDL